MAMKIRGKTPSKTQWFNPNDLIKHPVITLQEPIYGYVLPHAGTAYTGQIISHILRFRGQNWQQITQAVIYYYPADPNDDHELTVPQQSINYLFGPNIKVSGVNLGLPAVNNAGFQPSKLGKTTLIIISADMSHFVPFQEAIPQENKAFHALMFKNWNDPRMPLVDDVITFKHVFGKLGKNKLTKDITMRWIARTRSPGESAVGYAGFLLVQQHQPVESKVVGLFATCYDADMNTRECLGRWGKYSPEVESELVKEVLTAAAKTSRLTGGQYTNIPIKYYTITYLYRTEITGQREFIRGWHGIKSNGAFYIPEVFLEDTFDNGRWITPADREWPTPGQIGFNLSETITSLAKKAGATNISPSYELYDTYTKNVVIGNAASNKPLAITLKKPRGINRRRTQSKV